MMESPCFTCTRVKDPQNCESKVCKEWRAWFIDRWEDMRRRIQREIAGAPVREHGLPLGGRHYAPPNQLHDFLHNDPCKTCHCPTDLCAVPCQLRLIWDERKGGKR